MKKRLTSSKTANNPNSRIKGSVEKAEMSLLMKAKKKNKGLNISNKKMSVSPPDIITDGGESDAIS